MHASNQSMRNARKAESVLPAIQKPDCACEAASLLAGCISQPSPMIWQGGATHTPTHHHRPLSPELGHVLLGGVGACLA